MNARNLIALVLLLPGLGAAYMAWMLWRVEDGGKWFFLVLAVFFLLLAVSPRLPQLKPKPNAEPAGTRFVPHWFMLLAVLVLIGVAVLALLGVFLRRG